MRRAFVRYLALFFERNGLVWRVVSLFASFFKGMDWCGVLVSLFACKIPRITYKMTSLS